MLVVWRILSRWVVRVRGVPSGAVVSFQGVRKSSDGFASAKSLRIPASSRTNKKNGDESPHPLN
jgi:hypothetical protein